jgi:hypothetical protein
MRANLQERVIKGRVNRLMMSGAFLLPGFLLATAVVGMFFAPLRSVSASAPSGGTLSPTSITTVTWSGTSPGGVCESESTCIDGVNCDTFKLTIGGSPADWAGKLARIDIDWLTVAHDYALSVHKGDNSGPVIAFSDNPVDSPRNWEAVEIDPAALGTGDYSVRVIYFAATAANQYAGTAKVIPKPPSSLDTSKAKGLAFSNYVAPEGVGNSAGEPTLGVNWKTSNVFYIAGIESLRVKFDDTTSPAQATWENVSAPTTSIETFDPILFTDSDAGAIRTNRTFVSQLLPSKISLMAFTDSDGQSWTPSQGAGINSGVDHQTVGGGPYAKNADGSLKGYAVQRPGPDGKFYPHAIYYASQDAGLAQIARSDDGGFTFGVAVPMYDLTECGGLHGQIKVAPDGTVYVPNKACKAVPGLIATKDIDQAVLVSEDNGMTWEVRRVPTSSAGETDPSVGIGADGTVYFGYSDGDGHPRVAVSRDKGRTWTSFQDLGVSLGIQNSVFPAAVGGDANRAAVFFLGTTTPGAAAYETDPAAFNGVWYGFIAMTYDGGKSWAVANATPGDPVQRGPICTQGTLCEGYRNLLDFNDATVDAQGRVLAAFADGCVSAECKQGLDLDQNGTIDGTGTARKATIIRQSGGAGLFSASGAKGRGK